tara:strand:+ start:1919 stop:2401 length:483 start_codon:yes stop_codon:yes gene_type:complete
VDDVLEKMKKGQVIVTGTSLRGKGDVQVFFCLDGKVGIKFSRTIVEKLKDQAACIISLEGPTTFTKKDARDHQNIQFMTFKQLFNDISKHHLFRPHRALNDAEKEEVMARYNIQDESQWPKLLQKDPAVVFHHFQKGEVIEIARRGVGGQEGTLYYRVVV